MANEFFDRFDSMFGDLDGRLKHRKLREVYGQAHPLMDPRLYEPCFCYCGKQGGYVTKDTPIVYVCQRCYEMGGAPPLLQMVPGTEDL